MPGAGEVGSWPRSAPPPLRQARLRERPEDFWVEEILPFAPAGTGEHLWLRLRKCGVETAAVAAWLARAAGVARAAVGYAGLKDRHAVAVQWFSVHLPGRDPPAALGDPPRGVEVLEMVRHVRKLRVGALAGNRFTITLRAVAADRSAFAERLESIRARGVPNYFGEQRFGRGGENIRQACAMFAGARVRDRFRRGLYLSAARSLIFNAVLARRVQAGNWDVLLAPGEAVILDGRRSFFLAEEADEILRARLARGDIHPSGPLWGAGELPTRAAARAYEEEVVAAYPALARGLEEAGLRQERRPLRVIPQELASEWLDGQRLRLTFRLPAGAYATAVLRELADYVDVSSGYPRPAPQALGATA